MKSTTRLSLKKENPVKLYQVLIPIALGLLVIVWLFVHAFDISVFSTFFVAPTEIKDTYHSNFIETKTMLERLSIAISEK